MPLLHNGLFRGTWNDALKRALGVTKDPGGLERFGETLTPSINLWERPEWAFLRQEFLWAARISQAAVAAEGSMGAIINPIGSNQILVVERVRACNGTAAGNVVLGFATEAQLLATLVASLLTGRDSRLGRNVPLSPFNTLNAQSATGSDPTIPFQTPALDHVVTAAVEMQEFSSPPFVIKPGVGLYVQCGTVNQILQASFSGYLRQSLPGEL